MDDTRLVGVTFNNSDKEGGENRQDLLAQLTGAPTYVTLENVIHHNVDTGLGEVAIQVRSDITGKILGFIAKDEIHKWNKTGKMVLTVGKYKDTYYGTLSIPQTPTPKQYGSMKSLLKKGIINKMPPYDRTIYQWAFDCARAKNPYLNQQ